MEIHSRRLTRPHEQIESETAIGFGCLKVNTSPKLRPRALRQLANSKLLKLDRRAFRLQAKIPGRRTDMGAAGHFLAVDPQPDFAIDGSDVIMVPLTDAFAQVLSRKTPLAIRRRGRKWLHGGG